MSNLEIYKVTLDDAYKLIEENIYNCKTVNIDVLDNEYHHNLSSDRVLNTLKNGILSKRLALRVYENRDFTQEEIYRYSDPCSANGTDFVSLARMKEDFSYMKSSDLDWNAYEGINPDIIISKDIDAKRNNINYFNEYNVPNSITIDKFTALDIRLLKIFTEKFYFKEQNTPQFKVDLMLKEYEYLRSWALFMLENNIDIPIREASLVKCVEDENTKSITFDKQKLITLPRIILK